MKKIQVTREDIQAGKCGDPEFCPIALAAKRVFKETMLVGTYDMNPLNNSFNRIELPAHAREFICRFDDNKKVEPFEFEVPALWSEAEK